MVSIGFIHAKDSDFESGWAMKNYILSTRNYNTARQLNDQKTKSRLNPVCIEIVTITFHKSI